MIPCNEKVCFVESCIENIHYFCTLLHCMFLYNLHFLSDSVMSYQTFQRHCLLVVQLYAYILLLFLMCNDQQKTRIQKKNMCKYMHSKAKRYVTFYYWDAPFLWLSKNSLLLIMPFNYYTHIPLSLFFPVVCISVLVKVWKLLYMSHLAITSHVQL